MGTGFQIVVDCADPGRLALFWAEALGYRVEGPPAGFADWREYWLSVGVPPDEAGDGSSDSIVDPDGAGPRIWFQQVPEAKTVKNRLHFDVQVGGGRGVPLVTRKEHVEAAAARLAAAGAVRVRVLAAEGIDHYAVAMRDPEGNEFDVV